jgi:predicted nucleic acid-binding protein
MANPATTDANVILRLILLDIPEQSHAAQKLLDRNITIHVNDLTIAEVVYVLGSPQYQFSRGEIVSALGAIIANQSFVTNTSLLRRVFALYLDHPSLSFVDCYSVFHAESNDNLPLYTFDKKLVSQSGGHAKLVS